MWEEETGECIIKQIIPYPETYNSHMYSWYVAYTNLDYSSWYS